MDYNEILKNARECSGPYCKACPVCNGMACRTQVPGPGGKGTAATMLRNYQKWQEVCINMDTICENAPIDTTFTLFGRKFAAPIFAAPVGAMKLHYGDKYDDLTYNDILVSSCAQAGIAAFTGDGTNPAVMEGALHAITAAGGLGVPTVKPWNMETVFAKLDAVRRADPMAVAMDIDAAGLPFLKGLTPPAGSKTVEELRQIIDYAQKPFIVKGVMTVRGALKALEAGASGIVVSNHGGRVQDQCPSTAEVLPAIADAVVRLLLFQKPAFHLAQRLLVFGNVLHRLHCSHFGRNLITEPRIMCLGSIKITPHLVCHHRILHNRLHKLFRLYRLSGLLQNNGR